MKFWRTILALVSMLGAGSALLWPRIARTQQSQRVPTIEEYNPKSTLVTKEHKPERAKFPFIDIHSHHWNPTPEHVDQLVREMDTINLRVLVNLSGGTGGEAKKTVASMKSPDSDRFVEVSDPSYDAIHTPRDRQRAAERPCPAVRHGSHGLTI